MLLRLEAVKFNHDESSAAADAINIRRNETVPVHVPEWRLGLSVNPADSPAAYTLCETRGNTLTIQAKFTCTDPRVEVIEVRAVDARITLPSPGPGLLNLAVWLARPLLRRLNRNVLGEVKQKFIFPCDGETGFETFELKNVCLWEGGVGLNDIAWRWQYRLTPSSPWVDFEVSRHRIYTILRLPTKPWEQDQFVDANTQLPWAEVLDYACNWASSTRFVDEAAARVTESVYDLGRSIIRHRGDGAYTKTSGRFDCTAFLERLRGGEGSGRHVNCTDCAAIVSTFANVLGCDLWQSQMSGFLYNFVKKIGHSAWTKTPFFNYHEMVWEDECDRGNDVYDACLQLDGDDDPSRPPHEPLLPANLRFGSQGDAQYQDRLVASANPDVGAPKPECRVRRTVGKKPLLPFDKFVNKELFEKLARLFEFEEWRELNLLDTNLFVLDSMVHEDLIPGWRRRGLEVIEATGWPRFIESFWRLTDYQKDIGLSFDLYESESVPDARRLLLILLTKIQTADMARWEDFGSEGAVGDVFFTSPDETRILFSRGNIVLVLRNLEDEVTPLLGVARYLDQILIHQSAARDGQVAGEVRRFELAGSAPFRLGPLPLRIRTPDPLKGTRFIYKFFTQTGKIFWRDGLTYEPDSVGPQKIVIFAVNAQGHALKQELEFDVVSA